MQRYPLIHKPKQAVQSQPPILAPVIGEGRLVSLGSKAYGHVILLLEPNRENDGCWMLWSVTLEFTPEMNPDYLLTSCFLEDVYHGLGQAIAEDGEHPSGTSYVPFPYINTNIRIIGGSEHLVDSKSFAYYRAAHWALADAVSKVGKQSFPAPSVPCDASEMTGFPKNPIHDPNASHLRVEPLQ